MRSGSSSQAPERRWGAGALACAALLAACGGSPGVSDGGGADAAPAPDGGPRPDGAEPSLQGPPYPIVLAHGFFGFDDFAGAGFVTYFYGVPERLAEEGEAEVFTPAVDPFNDSETRGAQLLAHIEAILAETGHARVNLIGHSQGGLDARYVAAVRPELVSSVTTYATPHGGTPIADVVLEIVEDPRLQELADALVRIIGAPLWDAAGEETSVFAALEQFSQPGMADFNARYVDSPEVSYYSLTGRTDLHPGGSDCAADDAPPFIARWDRYLDPVDPLLDISEQIVDGGWMNRVNDGLLRASDARWGRFLGCVPADHLDQVGQLLGDDPGLANPFDHLRLWVDLVAFLRAEGH